jgi:hypothetical protein
MPPAPQAPRGYPGRSTAAPRNGGSRPDDYYRAFQLVYLDQGSGDVLLRFHKTDIVRVRPNGEVLLFNGEYYTATTAMSMNDALYPMDMEVKYRGAAAKGDWYLVEPDGNELPFENGMVVPARTAEDTKRAEWLMEAYGGTAAVQALRARRVQGGGRASGGGGGGAASTSAASAARRAPAPAPAGARPAAPPTAAAAAAAPTANAWAGGSQAINGPAGGQAARPGGGSGGGGGGGASAPAKAAGPAAAAAILAMAQGHSVGPSVEQQLNAAVEDMGIADEHDDHMCVVCMARMRNTVLVPCGHMIMCEGCCKELEARPDKACPMCRAPIDEFCKIMG